MIFSGFAAQNTVGDMMKKLREILFVFLFGGILYSLIEIAFRGYTHWSMTLTGGTVFFLIYMLNKRMGGTNLLLRCAAGSAIITGIEFAVGCVVNLWLNLNVWDYSDRPLNILGQVCPLFSGVWFLLCIPAAGLSLLISRTLNGKSAVGKIAPDAVDRGRGKTVLMRRILQNFTFRNI